ncbi:MAG TPA: tyrosine-type recombinase/integrase [Edaphobacter sp.]|nr:tyrosine-type recombinase/integrase [Edaphobacter sp.]
MANRKVSLVRYCKTPAGWRRYSAVIGKNGRVKPGYVVVNGRHVEYPNGTYQARYYEGSDLRYLPVGDDAQQALAACIKHSKLLIARDSAKVAGAVIVEEKGRVNLAKALVRFIQAAKDRGAMVAAAKYKLASDEFLSVTGRRYADEVEADDLRRYQRALRQRGCSDRTVYNLHAYSVAFLRFAGVAAAAFPAHAPKYEKTLPETYTREELDGFFASLTNEQHIVTFKVALQCGLREQELMYLQWPDIDFAKKTLLVRSKPDWGFAIKDKEERSVPLPDGLSALLQAYKRDGQLFVTGTKGNKPNTHLLRTLKRLVKAAGLNCGVCGACVERGECERWFLHKFRSSYATALLRGGLDVRSVQKLIGHSDLESTMRYLRPAEDTALQGMVNAIQW